jgi:hypothetical protein
MHIPLKSLYTPLLRLLPVYVRFRISQLLKLFFRKAFVRREYRLSLNICEFRHPYQLIISSTSPRVEC